MADNSAQLPFHLIQRGIPILQSRGQYDKSVIGGEGCNGCGITKMKAEAAVKSLLDGVTAALKAGDKVTFAGFGSFSVSDRKARIGCNPQTGKEIKIAARKAVTFSVGKVLKEAVQAPVKKGKKKS